MHLILIVKRPFHIKEIFRLGIVFSLYNISEIRYRFLKRDIFAGPSRKSFSHKKRLGQEFLRFSRSRYNKLIFIGKFFQSQNCDYILKLLIALQNLLNISRYAIMFLPNYFWIKRR